MRVLVACEISGIVTNAFRQRGHDAWSCDLLPAPPDAPWPDYHLVIDARLAIRLGDWDLLVAHPPCTHTAVSGARYFAEKRRDGRQADAVALFLALATAPIRRIAIEHPVSILSTLYRKPDQIIQPWQFGHPESKTTCLWLTNLPPLRPTNVLSLPASGRWQNQTPSGQNRLGPSPDRAQRRSTTYLGIADAMADQWGAPAAEGSGNA